MAFSALESRVLQSQQSKDNLPYISGGYPEVSEPEAWVKPIVSKPVTANIPVELKQQNTWTLWDYKPSKRGGKPRKIPMQFIKGRLVPSDPTSAKGWSTFEKVFDDYKESGASGIGFCFSNGDDFIGIDVDGVLVEEDGKTRFVDGPKGEIAGAILDRFQGLGLVERSVSGTGFHIIVRGEWKGGWSKAPGHNFVECYDLARYFVTSGNLLVGYTSETISDAQDALDWLAERFPKRNAPMPQPERDSPSIDESIDLNPEVVKRTLDWLKQADGGAYWRKFGEAPERRLFRDEEWREPFDSASDLDWRVIQKAAWFLVLTLRVPDEFVDAYLIDVYRGWPGSRGEDGLRKARYAIPKAVSSAFSKRSEEQGAGTWNKKQTPLGYGGAEDAAHLIGAGALLGIDYKRIPPSDAAHILAAATQGLRAYTTGFLFSWAGDHWKGDEDDPDSDPETLFYRLCAIGCHPKGFAPRYIKDTLEVVRKLALLPLPKADRNKIPFSNGLLDMSTGELESLTSANAATWVLPHEYDAGADCSFFQQWLRDVTGDEGCVQLIRAFVNATLKGRADLQTFLLLLGEGGTGKSLFMQILTLLVGSSNTHSTSMGELESDRFEIVNCANKRLVIVPDVERYKGKVSRLKQLTGGDLIGGSMKNIQRKFKFTYQGMVLITANESQLKGDDHTSGFARRRLVVRFVTIWSKAQKSSFNARGGEKRLIAEIPGIIRWALELSDTEVSDLVMDPPEAAAKATFEETLANNDVAAWVADNLVYEQGVWTQVGTKNTDPFDAGSKDYEWLFRNFLRYCRENNMKGGQLLTTNTFSQNLVEVLRTTMRKPNCWKERRAAGIGVVNVRFRQSDEEPYDWRSVNSLTYISAGQSKS